MTQHLQNYIKQLKTLSDKENISKSQIIELINLIEKQDFTKEDIHTFLPDLKNSKILKAIYSNNLQESWIRIIVELIHSSNFHVGYMIEKSAMLYYNKIAFKSIKGNNIIDRTYQKFWNDIIKVAESILFFEKSDKTPVVGLLTNNRYKGILIDLACLSFGIRIIPIPLNFTSEHLNYVIEESNISHLFIGGGTANRLWNGVASKHQIQLIAFDDPEILNGNVLDWDSFFDSGKKFNIIDRLGIVSMDWIATIMYTSGTTANPKGIPFNHINMISKRFARAIALPEINSSDTFLSYLPLFHTFGRFFEMMGSIFWGSTYVFAESPAFNSLLKDFQLVSPTIFISIPKRWVQLYETIEEGIDLDRTESKQIKLKIKELTGEKLKLGLSAAGYLDPDIFSFFQNNDINLLSGYGMTEATGGITMTPTDDYVGNSVGKALPGIKLKIEKDGELCLSGSYVTNNYFNESDSDDFKNGWFYTGDIFEERDGHYFFVDRKKDIYKNSRGQTIAPQKIENMFQDFESVKSIFLVGDGKEFNTVLIYPDKESSSINLADASNKEIRSLFNAMILSVNNFLPPYERIVNFAIINRDFSENHGEVTSKNTFRRNKILENFSDTIEPMYERNYISLHLGAKEIRIPNWLIREIGATRTDVKWDGEIISAQSRSKSIKLIWEKNQIFLGDFQYNIDSDILDIGALIQSPVLWVGNIPFSDFTGDIIFRLKDIEPYSAMKIKFGTFSSIDKNTKTLNYHSRDNLLRQLHITIRKFLRSDESFYESLVKIVDSDNQNWSGVILESCLAHQMHPDIKFRHKLIESIGPMMSGEFFINQIKSIYSEIINYNSSSSFSFDIRRTTDDHYKSLIQYLKDAHASIDVLERKEINFIQILLLMVSDFGVYHPTRYIWARSELIWWQVSDVPKPLYSTAQKAYYALTNGFRDWIGPSTKLTVDQEKGREYGWKDVIVFDENVHSNFQALIKKAIEETSLIRESVFLLCSNCLIQLQDIPDKGIWITRFGSEYGKNVFRVLIRTRRQGTHNMLLNINTNLDREFIEEEVKWLITMGSGFKDKPLVENFGGYWPEYNLYTEEFISEETVTEFLERNRSEIINENKKDRWQMRWLHYIWNGIQAYQEFWSRTNLKYIIQPPNTDNLIIPRHDYATGTRITSITTRKKIESLSDYFIDLFTEYIEKSEKNYIGLKRMSDWEVIFTATIQALKVKKGEIVLKRLEKELKIRKVKKQYKQLNCDDKRIARYLEELEKFGVLTKPVVFASLRFQRWLDLNPKATKQARASILQELYQDYRLDDLLEEYPETRVRFFMMTCFKDAGDKLITAFQNIIKLLRNRDINPFNIHDYVQEMQENIDLTDDHKFFLARMLFPHVSSADYVELVPVSLGEDEQLNLVFQTEAKNGQIYHIRPPFHPKEIAKFHSLLSEALLASTFTHQHEFLLLFNFRNRLAGGLYWKNVASDRVHLEWVVINEQNQNLSLSQRLLSEYYERMRFQGIKIITVGFYLENFFYKQGFLIDEHYGGLVKKL